MTRKRSRIEVIYDILNVIKEKDGRIRPTHILYKSNLSHQMMAEYITELLAKGFIIEKTQQKSKTYSLTEKGKKYIDQYTLISEFTSTFGLSSED